MVNYIVCVLVIAVILLEIVLIVKRNKMVELKGKSDLFIFTLILFLTLVVFPMEEYSSVITGFRNMLLLVAILGSMGIKRGLSENGIEKLFHTIKWESITGLYVEEYQTSKIRLRIVVGRSQSNIYFNMAQTKSVIKYLQDRNFQVNISEKIKI